MEFIKHNIKLFIISGKSGSGKNLVSKIIEEYYEEKKCITISFAYYLKDYIKRITKTDITEENKPRDFLQQLGIELIKNKIDNKLLINRIIQDIEVFSYFYDIIIINDARIIEEIQSIKEKYNDSITIRINSNEVNNKLTISQQNHITETGLDNYLYFDYIINNNFSYDKLKEEVENILRSV